MITQFLFLLKQKLYLKQERERQRLVRKVKPKLEEEFQQKQILKKIEMTTKTLFVFLSFLLNYFQLQFVQLNQPTKRNRGS